MTRSNEEIVTDARFDWFSTGDERPFELVILAALAAAGRLVTPEHDAQVWDEGFAEGSGWALDAYRGAVDDSVAPVNPYATLNERPR